MTDGLAGWPAHCATQQPQRGGSQLGPLGQLGDGNDTREQADHDELPMVAIAPARAMEIKPVASDSTADGRAEGDNAVLCQAMTTGSDGALLLPTKKRRGRPPAAGPNVDSPRRRPARSHSGLPRRRKPKATDRSSEFLISWLLEHYEASDSISLPRTAIFSRYTSESLAMGLPPINPASFGKVIRAVFKGVRTRRLGTRGHSKYHYFGIAPRGTRETAKDAASTEANESAVEGAVQGEPLTKGKPSCLLVAQEFLRRIYKHQARPEQQEGEREELADDRSPVEALSRSASTLYSVDGSEDGERRDRPRQGRARSKSKDERPTTGDGAGTKKRSTFSETAALPSQTGARHESAFESPYDPLVPDFNEFSRFLSQICQPIPEKLLGTSISSRQMGVFGALYQGHIVHLLRLISAREFHLVEGALNQFWSAIPSDLYGCLHAEEALRIVSIADDYLFQVAIHILVPDVLEPLPLPIAQAIRFFAKSLDVAIGAGGASALFDSGIPQAIQVTKLEATSRFSAVLRRRTALNHLAQAVKTILGGGESRGMMLVDWANLDWFAIQEQLHWIMPGQADWVVFVEGGWRGHLNEGANLQQWITWLEIMVDTCLGSDAALGIDMEVSARTIIMRWSLLTSLIMRDMTLRSAASFGTSRPCDLLILFLGSYHLLRMFLDEHVMYYLEKRVDEQRRAIGLLAYWPPQMMLTHNNNNHSHNTCSEESEQPPAGLNSQCQQHMSYEKVMAGFASMDELFRKSGLLAYAQQQ